MTRAMTADVMKCDAQKNAVYQVDCLMHSKGKRVAASKRRIRWRFGFSDTQSMSKGLSGIDCRGEEHEVVMVWSLTSGKQLILADGCEVHFASARLRDKFECSWTMKGNIEVKVVASLFASAGRQFDLFLNGQSFWDMPKIFELGKSTSGSVARPRALNNFDRMQSCPPDFQTPGSMDSIPAVRSHSLPKDLLSDALQDLLLDSPSDTSSDSNIFDEFAPAPSRSVIPTSVSSPCLSVLTDLPSLALSPSLPSLVTPDSGSCSVYTPYEDSVDMPFFQDFPAPVSPEIRDPVEQALRALVILDNNNLQQSPVVQKQPPTKEIMQTHHHHTRPSHNAAMVVCGQGPQHHYVYGQAPVYVVQ